MPGSVNFEQKFYQSLRDLFVGATIEGRSGFVNLMKIKSNYFNNGVLPHLKQDIEQSLSDFPEFRTELFEKLYTFFKRYFSESGSIYFSDTAFQHSIYDRVYTNERDIALHWKTHMLYYVKTDHIFRSVQVESDGFRFFFDASQIEHKRSNERRDLVFKFRKVAEDQTLVFDVIYSEQGRLTNIEDILRTLHKSGITIHEDQLERAFGIFQKQSEVDYFINKDARSFLREQFDLYMYQYLFSGQNIWSEERIKQLQTLKEIAFKVIDFIAQFEDELVKVWNKPKFVLGSHYVITFSRILSRPGGKEIVEKILSHQNMKLQIEEWKKLELVPQTFALDDLINKEP